MIGCFANIHWLNYPMCITQCLHYIITYPGLILITDSSMIIPVVNELALVWLVVLHKHVHYLFQFSRKHSMHTFKCSYFSSSNLTYYRWMYAPVIVERDVQWCIRVEVAITPAVN